MTKPQAKPTSEALAKPPRRRPFTLALVAACLVVLAALGYYFGSGYLEARDHWRQAEAAIDKQDFAGAKEHLDHCLAYWSNDPETHFVMARTCRRWGAFDTARKHLLEAERRGWNSQDIELEHLLGSVQQRGPTRSEGETLARQLAAHSPHGQLILEALVTGLFTVRRIPEAKRWLNHWVEHYPEDWVAYYWRGHLNYLIGGQLAAHADLEQAMRLRPDHEDVRQLLITVQLASGNYRQALEQLEIRLQARPDDVEALANRARCQRNLGDLAAAQATLDQLFEKHSDSASAILTKALLEADRDRPEAALHWLSRFEKLPPGEVSDLVAAAQLAVGLYRRLGKEAEARQRQEQLESLLRDQQAVKEAMLQIGSGANDPALYTNTSVIYMRLRLGKEAEALLQRVLTLRPNHREAHRLLAELYQNRGDAESLRLAEQHRQRAGGDTRKQERR